MAWWIAIPAVVSLASSAYSAYQQNSHGGNEAAWTRYNAEMQYQTELGNLASEAEISLINAQLKNNGIISNQDDFKYQL